MKQKPLYRRTIIAVAKTNYAKEYLTFTPLEDRCTLSFDNSSVDLSYSYDKKNWNEFDGEIEVVQPLYIRGKNPEGLSGTFLGDGSYNISGNIMSIIDFENLSDTMVGDFYRLFGADSEDDYSAVTIKNAENLILPSILTDNAFEGMFFNNSLEIPPKLPATILTTSCYEYMFYNCELKVAPELPATKLVDYCYSNMFYGCSKIKQINVSFTQWIVSATNSWVEGIATTGNFVCPRVLPKEFGTSKIPTGWAVVTE